MSGELPGYVQDIKWFFATIERHGLPKPSNGDVSAFTERVAIKLENDRGYFGAVNSARTEAFEEYCSRRDKIP